MSAHDVYFFGCWNSIGHYLWHTRGHDAYQSSLPWKQIDAALCPKSMAHSGRETEPYNQHEGHAALHHKDDWTALAWWDRSVNKRYGSNAALFARGTFTAEQMLDLGREVFPRIMSRFTYTITTEADR